MQKTKWEEYPKKKKKKPGHKSQRRVRSTRSHKTGGPTTVARDRGQAISLTGQRTTSVQIPLMHGNFPKKIQLDTSQYIDPSGTPIIHENPKKHPGAHSLRSLAQCSITRSEIPSGKTELSLDLRISASCEGGIYMVPSNSEIREHALHYYTTICWNSAGVRGKWEQRKIGHSDQTWWA
jgi:hypothetical protein